MPKEPLMLTLYEMDAREAAASEKLNALCNGERFRMSIPVSPTDADSVIGNALSDLRLAIAMVRERDAEIARLQEYAGLLERGLGAHEARATVWPAKDAEIEQDTRERAVRTLRRDARRYLNDCA